jgi:hypothetical protein
LLAAVVTDGAPGRLARAETSKGDVAKATITTVSKTLTRRTTTQGTSIAESVAPFAGTVLGAACETAEKLLDEMQLRTS